MENPKQKKSSVWKLIGAFVAGVLITAIVMLATTGTMFTGFLRPPIKTQDSRLDMAAERPDIPSEVSNFCPDNCELRDMINATNNRIDYTEEFLNSFKFTGNLPKKQ